MKLNTIHKFDYKITYDNLDLYSVMYHPEYLKVCDIARNASFEKYGYPVDAQLTDGVGFTIARIKSQYRSPCFMSEELSIFTLCTEAINGRCNVTQYISPVVDQNLHPENDKEKLVFIAEYLLVFVDLNDIKDFPFNRKSIKRMKTPDFSDKVKKILLYP